MNNRFIARPERTPGQNFPRTRDYPDISVKTFRGGLNTEDDPTDIEDDAFVEADNVYIRNLRVTRREGESLLTPTKPDSSPVRIMATFKDYLGTLFQLRATDNKLYRRGVSWEEIVSTGTSFALAPNNIISVDGRCFFSTNGNKVIQEIDFGTDEYSDLGNAPRYKYITAFGDRIVGLSLEAGSPVEVGWSGNLNYDEFDPLVDPSAGNVPLVESQADYGDFGTGIFGFADKLLVVKERSMWLASKTGAGTNPFYFYLTSPSLGCDTPTSIQRLPNGIVYYDRTTNNVYVMDVNNPIPTPIGSKVNNAIIAAIDDPATIFSSFDPIELEYRLGVPQAGSSEVKIFVYSFKIQQWWTESREDITCMANLNFDIFSTLIGDLVGDIGDLLGTIGNLGSSVSTPTTFFGRQDGDIEQIDTDVVDGYVTTLRSKTWQAENNVDFFTNRLTFTYNIIKPGSFDIAYSRDNGISYTTYKTVTMDVLDIGKRLVINCVKAVKGRMFNWKITCSTGQFSLVDFKALTAPSGLSKNG